MRVLHLSDSTLSGSPIRISDLLTKYTDCNSRHMVWEPVSNYWRKFKTDLVSSKMSKDEIKGWLDWADVIHYHNRWKSQKIFSQLGLPLPKKPSVIQMHSPRRDREDFSEVLESELPIAIIAQYHVREWPELKFIVPNVVDIHDVLMKPLKRLPNRPPIISYAPSNCTAKGWNDKGYARTAPLLKRWKLSGKIQFQLIVGKPHEEAMRLKALADVGIDEIVTGSYHLSSLEYLSLGVPCFANLDEKTEAVLYDLTGASSLPWLKSNPERLKQDLLEILRGRKKLPDSRKWMETYWNPEFLSGKYIKMYEAL